MHPCCSMFSAWCYQYHNGSSYLQPRYYSSFSVTVSFASLKRNLTFTQNVAQVRTRTKLTNAPWDFSLSPTYVWNHYYRNYLPQKVAGRVYFIMSYKLTSKYACVSVCVCLCVCVCCDVIFWQPCQQKVHFIQNVALLEELSQALSSVVSSVCTSQLPSQNAAFSCSQFPFLSCLTLFFLPDHNIFSVYFGSVLNCRNFSVSRMTCIEYIH